MPNIGLVPIPDSPVGVVRALIGDTSYIELSPTVAGRGDYAQFSDVELAAFLLQGADSPLRAAGHAYFRLASNAAFEARSVGTDDLRIDTTKRATDFRLLGVALFEQADKAEAIANSASDIFDIVSFNQGRQPIPEMLEVTSPYQDDALEESAQYPGLWS